MSINSFDKDNLKNIRVDINTALKAVETKYGIKLDLGNIRFQADSFHVKLSGSIGEAAEATEDSEVKWRRAFVNNFWSASLGKEDLGKEVFLMGKKYILVGARPKARNPIVLKNPQSEKYIAASVYDVERALGKK